MYPLRIARRARLLRPQADAPAFEEVRRALPNDGEPVLGRAAGRRWGGRRVGLGPVCESVEGAGEPAGLRHQEASEPHLKPHRPDPS
jgi:hypothetical protein